jgi:hypothetical protein
VAVRPGPVMAVRPGGSGGRSPRRHRGGPPAGSGRRPAGGPRRRARHRRTRAHPRERRPGGCGPRPPAAGRGRRAGRRAASGTAAGGGVVGEQGELDQVVAGPRHHGEVVVPAVGADQALVGHAVQVLPPDGLQGQGLAERGLGRWVLVLPVRPQRLPETLGKAGLVAVAALGDDRRDRARVDQGQPPAGRCAVLVQVHRVPGHPGLGQQTRGQAGERVEGVTELAGGRGVGQAEADVVRGDQVVPVGQQRDQVAEHEPAGREAVQQHHLRRATRSRLPVEQSPCLDGGVTVVDGCHLRSPSGSGGWMPLA